MAETGEIPAMRIGNPWRFNPRIPLYDGHEMELFPIGRNPMELVSIRGGIKRRSKPAILSQRQVALLLKNIREDYVRLFVILGMCLGNGCFVPVQHPLVEAKRKAMEALAVSTKTAGYDTNHDTNASPVSTRPV